MNEITREMLEQLDRDSLIDKFLKLQEIFDEAMGELIKIRDLAHEIEPPQFTFAEVTKTMNHINKALYGVEPYHE